MSSTIQTLKNWRFGRTIAECLAADILSLEGFKSIDPQAPIGGPDGVKDILCEKDGINMVCGVYFPSTDQAFSSIKEKFENDLEGVHKNKRNGFVFITNQELTIGQREELVALAKNKDYFCEIYHLERLRAILDNPIGYGVRLEYLRITMSEEEQISYFKNRDSQILLQLKANQLGYDRLVQSMERMEEYITRSSLAEKVGNPRAKFDSLSEEEVKSALKMAEMGKAPHGFLSLYLLNIVHRAISLGSGLETYSGTIREVNTWITGKSLDKEDAAFIPPSHDKVGDLIQKLIDQWNYNYRALRHGNREKIINAIADFHREFLYIHPYIDGNGRVARVLMYHQVGDLLGKRIKMMVPDRKTYYDALQAGHGGNPEPMRKIVAQICNL